MLFFPFPRSVAVSASFHDKKSGPFGCSGQNGDKIRVQAGGNELLAAVYFVSDDVTGIIGHRIGLGLDGNHIAAGIRLSDRIGNQGLACCNGTEPFLLLLFGACDDDRIGTQLNGKKSGGDTQANFGHLPDHRTAVPCAAPHPAVSLRQHQQLQSDFRTQHFADGFFREYLLTVVLQYFLLGQKPLSQLGNGIQNHLPGLLIQSLELGFFRSHRFNSLIFMQDSGHIRSQQYAT